MAVAEPLETPVVVNTPRQNSLARGMLWVTCITVVLLGFLANSLNSRLKQAEAQLARSQTQIQALRTLANPHSAAKLRDQGFEFTVNNYGFEYTGKTGEVIDDYILAYGLWEKEIAFFMRDCLLTLPEDQRVFVDVGCNAGHHALFLSQYAKQIHGIDPYPPAIERFQKLIERNRFQNIVTHQVGLGAKEGSLPFYAPVEENFGSGTFSKSYGEQGERRLISESPIVRGDDLFEKQGVRGIGLIKIDIEGFEEFALQGLQSTMQTMRPVVVIEISTPPAGTMASYAQLQSLFPKDYQFLAFRARQDANYTGRYRLEPFEPLAENFFARQPQGMLAAIPAERLESIPREPAASETPAATTETAAAQ